MKDIKAIVAGNIAQLRQASGMTQLELAQKLNYSDKAVSKWERGESIPDISVLTELAGLFGVTLDYLVEAQHAGPAASGQPRYRRSVITAVSVMLVWLVSVFFYVVISLGWRNASCVWLCFIYAMPASFIVWLVLNSVWFNRKRNYLIISLLMWSALVAIHVTLASIGIDAKLIYLLGAPGQLIILLWSVMKKSPSK